ncbi:iron ABC transporter ATP-binding protein [Xaviernesmea oryzae]|uniref:Iron ABC transporter ATP-binding protein n=1 Tax=Xaviernesmea oryzae TaxID=464029 RepID=A0A1Q9B1N0_9HYPH|nr:ABC transporter ATP-binding protein [Xaviernesmea oryzae]OLP61933.1 iron ABC transporter ATP-binding protein [Xaviernesmea oryzae]SEL00827.1 iron complex transport system ATP-binding protein [Xaviernesmea oryzae]
MSCNAKGAALAAEWLSWGPRAGLDLVRDVSFAIPAGARLAILGANGAGKTSLLRCLYRAVQPRAGRVLIDGTDLAALSPREVARHISVVLQEMPADFPFTVRDVVMMGRIPRRSGLAGWQESDRQACDHALSHLELTSFADRAFSSLSGGEKQRVLVARALAQDPEILILDEPTNHLDIRHQLEILALLEGLGLTVVTTLHDINLAGRFATHVALMAQGRLIGFGAPDEVLDAGALSAAFGVTAHCQGAREMEPPRFSFSLAANS